MVHGDNPTSDGPFSVGELENRARALAMERAVDPDRVLGIARRGSELADRHGEPFPHLVLAQLRVALGVLASERALEVFEREDLRSLVVYAPYHDYLMDPDTPLYTWAELASLIREFGAFLLRHQEAIVRDGDAHLRFNDSRWLDRRLSRLYYMKVSNAAVGAGDDDPRELDIWRLRDSLGERAHDRGTKQVKLDPTDATRMLRGRAKLFDLKVSVLGRIEEALHHLDAGKLWVTCQGLMNNALSAEEVAFYLRMDRFYRGDDAARDGLWDEPPPMRLAALPGGFSDLLEVLGHCECELRCGVMHRTKEEILALSRKVGQSDWQGGFCNSYYDVLDRPWRTQIDGILRGFAERSIDARYMGFWGEFRDRLTDVFRKHWLWTPHDWAVARKEIERMVTRAAQRRAAEPEAPDDLPDADATAQPAIENLFEKDQRLWRVRFSGLERPVEHVKGMHFIAYLLEHPYVEMDVVNLRHEFEPPENMPSGTMTLEQAAAAGLESDPLARPGKRGEDHVRGPRDKARDVVKATVARAMALVKDAHPALYDHLKLSLTIGNRCIYKPAKPTHWNRPILKRAPK